MIRVRSKFADLFRVKHGHAFKGEFFDTTGDYVLLTPGNFNEDGGFREVANKQRHYTGDVPDGFILAEGDVIVAMTEQMEGLLGSSAWIPSSDKYLHNQRLGRIVDLDESRIDRRYLYHLFNTPSVRHQISASASGTKVRHTAPERIGRVEVELPTLASQRKIADTLTAYDDLMENNLRRMALHEEAVQQLYREWFFHLRFPGHERARVVNGFPQGWDRKTLKELTSYLKRGIAPHYDDDVDGLVINQKCIRDGRLNLSLARHQSREFGPDRQIQLGDVLVNSTGEGTLGRIAQVKASVANCTVDTHVTIVRPNPGIPMHYFGMAVMAWEGRFSTMGRGATNQTELSPTAIGETEIVMPSKILLEQFDLFAEPIFRQVTNLVAQNDKLKAARDLLLPRVMSGEIAI
jgi:type I restriction enzyme, S subunit